jgi:hypothetical protein
LYRNHTPAAKNARGSSHELEKRRRREKIKEEGRGEKNSEIIGSSKERKGVHSFSLPLEWNRRKRYDETLTVRGNAAQSHTTRRGGAEHPLRLARVLVAEESHREECHSIRMEMNGPVLVERHIGVGATCVRRVGRASGLLIEGCTRLCTVEPCTEDHDMFRGSRIHNVTGGKITRVAELERNVCGRKGIRSAQEKQST